jgi:hypothetical protein
MSNKKSVLRRKNVSRFGEKVLSAMMRENAVPILCGQKFKIGRTVAPKTVIEELARNQLVKIEQDGTTVLTDIGEKFLLRRSAERREPKGNASTRAQPNPFAQQHLEPISAEIEIDGRRHRITRNLAEGPLGWLRRRRDSNGRPLISADQFEAGEQLRRDFEVALLRPNVTMSYDGVPSDRRRRTWRQQGSTYLERNLYARKRVGAALGAVGPGLADVLYRVCCHLEGLGEVERRLGWPQRSGKVILTLALDRLVDHYQGDQKRRRPKAPVGK